MATTMTTTTTTANAISCRHLGKCYQVSVARASREPAATTLAEAMLSALRRGLRVRARPPQTRPFWALRDVNIDIPRGEVIGVIGRNGAGKSTLLKLLSRIASPTTGRVEVWGRVGSLLEVGTGFHPELTGRENIFLNGSILGMSRREIRRQMGDIVDFAGVQEFLDTPVKRYSSGMYVRLAFAVAAHLEASVLLVDEVLAVGDAAFQRRCLGKMRELAGGGRTVLFVSHSMQAVSMLCSSAIYLDAGRVVYQGDVAKATEMYLNYQPPEPGAEAEHRRGGSGEIRITAIDTDRHTYLSTDDIVLDIETVTYVDVHPQWFVSVRVMNQMGVGVLHLDSRVLNVTFGPARRRQIRVTVTSPRLAQGEYSLDAFICHPAGIIDRYERAASFVVAPILPYVSTRSDCVNGALVYAAFDVTEVGAEPIDFEGTERVPGAVPCRVRAAAAKQSD